MLTLDQMSVTYPGNVVALKPTSLTFNAGDFTVLLGLSGAGKSTLLRSLNGLVKPSAGVIRSGQHGDIHQNRRALRQHRRHTAMVFQHHQLIGRLSALQNVLTGRLGYLTTWQSLLPRRDEELDMALAALDRVGLDGRAMTRVDQLSGGQRQRVGIARALVQQPTMLLADEPVASLDPATSRQVLELIRNICRERDIAVVMSLHQLEYAREFADRIVGLAHLQVVFDGAPQAINESALQRIYATDTPLHKMQTSVIAPRKHPEPALQP